MPPELHNLHHEVYKLDRNYFTKLPEVVVVVVEKLAIWNEKGEYSFVSLG